MTLFRSASDLPESSRLSVCAALNLRLADGIDLYTQLKVAHWNIKGPGFGALHPLFDTIASEIAGYNDTIAERLVSLGGRALGSARIVAATSALQEFPPDTTRDMEHVEILSDRLATYAAGLGKARAAAVAVNDEDTANMLTEIKTAVEKHAFFLNATLDE